MRKLLKTIIATALVVSMSLAGISTVYATNNYASESLNNKTDGSVNVEKVDGANNKGQFRVNMSDTHDKIVLYQLAVMTYNVDTFKEPAWVPEVTEWLSDGNAGGGSAYAAYSTPTLLGQATSTIQTNFYKDLVKYIKDEANADKLTGLQSYSSSIDTDEIATVPGEDKVVITADNYEELGYKQGTNEDGTFYYLEETPDVHLSEGQVVQEASSGYFEVRNVPIGIYLIAGQSSGGRKTYSPATVNLIPELLWSFLFLWCQF